MADFALLNNIDHRDIKIITERSARYGDDVMHVPTFPFEFRNVQAFYPILFQQDANGGFFPVALLGFQEKENLFLDEDGWHASYIPAMLRREPFLIGFQDSAEASGPDRIRVLSLDMEHPRVNTVSGEALFQPLGGRTPFLEDAADLLETIYTGLEHNKAFTRALADNDLIEAVTLEVEVRDGTRSQLIGYHCLNEEKVQALSGATLGTLNREGFLLPMFMALASMSNIQRLVELKNKAIGGAIGGGASDDLDR